MNETDRVTAKVKSVLGETAVRSQAFSTVCQCDKMLFSLLKDQKRIWGFLKRENFSFCSAPSLLCNKARKFSKEIRSALSENTRGIGHGSGNKREPIYRPEVPCD